MYMYARIYIYFPDNRENWIWHILKIHHGHHIFQIVCNYPLTISTYDRLHAAGIEGSSGKQMT